MTTAKERYGRVDFQRLVNDFADLRVWHGCFDLRAGQPLVGAPDVYVRWANSEKQLGASGTCNFTPYLPADDVRPYVPPTFHTDITITIGTNATAAHIVQLLLHELTHAAGWIKHDNCFHNTLREAVREAYGVDCDAQWSRVYEYDVRQVEALQAQLGDTLVLPMLPEGADPAPGRRPASIFDEFLTA